MTDRGRKNLIAIVIALDVHLIVMSTHAGDSFVQILAVAALAFLLPGLGGNYD